MNVVTAKRFTITEYHRLVKLGFFGEDDRVELIKGEILLMVAKGKSHSVCNTRLYRELFKLVGDKVTLRGQEPITILDDSEPEPDLVIVQNRDDDYLGNHPASSDILLLVEISDSSLKYDQEIKSPLYAEAGIANYWIFNLINHYLECYDQPYQGLEGIFGYRRKLIFMSNEVVSLPFFSDLSLNLSQVFPG